MKKLFLILVSLCSFAISANAQFRNQEMLFMKVGESINHETGVDYLHFNNDGDLYIVHYVLNDILVECLKDGTIYERHTNDYHRGKRDYELDSSHYYIYSIKGRLDVLGNPFTAYYAIKKDCSEMVSWTTDKYSGKISNKIYHKAISVTDLEPKKPNIDFLN